MLQSAAECGTRLQRDRYLLAGSVNTIVETASSIIYGFMWRWMCAVAMFLMDVWSGDGIRARSHHSPRRQADRPRYRLTPSPSTSMPAPSTGPQRPPNSRPSLPPPNSRPSLPQIAIPYQQSLSIFPNLCPTEWRGKRQTVDGGKKANR